MNNGMDMFLSVLTSKYDEGMAHVRDLIKRSGNDEMSMYAVTLIEETHSDDVKVALRGYLSLVGLLSAWLPVLEEERDATEAP